uniref:Solute carrier family 35 member C2-like n=1 Tax=Drosophila rhopaloa TaxID=1041015 RepID=A0A6P4DUC8_DRORH
MVAAKYERLNSSAEISGGSPGSTEATTSAQENMMMQMAVGTLFIILLYLTLSISLTFYQTDINRQMHFPLAIVSYHLVIKFLLAALARRIYRMRVGRSRVQLDWRVALRKMAPTGVASAIDIGFSNWGLALVPISLYTMTKSSTIVFILLFAIALDWKK